MPRKLQALGKGAPSVESSLDDFISRANQEVAELPDASATTSPVQREQALQSEVDDLKKRLAAVATRKRPSQGWGKLVIGYVLGCASIFAVSALMPKDSPPAPVQSPTTAVTPSAPVASPPPPVQTPIVTPLEEPKPTPAPVVAEPEPPPPPATMTTTTTTTTKMTKKPRRPAQPPQQAPAQAGSGDLYNPF